jgi:hypothetical protein
MKIFSRCLFNNFFLDLSNLYLCSLLIFTCFRVCIVFKLFMSFFCKLKTSYRNMGINSKLMKYLYQIYPFFVHLFLLLLIPLNTHYDFFLLLLIMVFVLLPFMDGTSKESREYNSTSWKLVPVMYHMQGSFSFLLLISIILFNQGDVTLCREQSWS